MTNGRTIFKLGEDVVIWIAKTENLQEVKIQVTKPTNRWLGLSALYIAVQALPFRGQEVKGHVYCDQSAGWIKMPLGTIVGVGPGDNVLGDWLILTFVVRLYRNIHSGFRGCQLLNHSPSGQLLLLTSPTTGDTTCCWPVSRSTSRKSFISTWKA